MIQRFTLLLMALLCWAAPSAAQQEAAATVFHRATDAGVEVAIQIKVSPTWHLYHTELGPADAIGQVTTIELASIGAEFGELRFPKPHKSPMEWGANNGPTWAYTHGGTFVVYAFGLWDDEPDEDLTIYASLAGQTCSDITGTCIPYEEELESSGAGPDALFANFPADLRPAVQAPVAKDTVEAPVESAKQKKQPAPFKTGNLADLYAGQNDHARATLHHRVNGERIEAVVSVSIDETWHLFHTDLGAPDAIGLAAQLKLQAAGVTWETPVFPEPHKTDQEWGSAGKPTWSWTHGGDFKVYVAGTFSGEAPDAVTGTLVGQVCSDVSGECIKVDLAMTSAGAGDAALYAGLASAFANQAANQTGKGGAANQPKGTKPTGTKGTSSLTNVPPDASSPGAPDGGRSLWEWILLGIGGGLFTLLMPCTYPMIPITVSFFTKQAEKTGKPPLSLSIAYGIGIVLIFEVIALAVGPVIILFATHWLTNLLIGLVFFYFALVLLGVLNLNPPQFLLRTAGTASQKGGFLGVFLMGATLVVTSFTCTAPIVSTILTAGASSGSYTEVIVGMAAFGATMAIPFMFLSMVPGKISSIPSAGEWMNTLKVTLGFVELAAAFKFLSNWDVALQMGWLPDEILLMIWIVILGVAGFYLLGQIKLTTSGSERITPVRSLFGMTTLALVGYFLMLLLGYPRGDIMTAFLPGYSNGALTIGAAAPADHTKASHELFVDDYQAAKDAALAQHKWLLVNLTGVT
jgi:thiol:disulfide interchange protein/DsbC/DsbD-like thiol-disulfide interchange protein